MALDGEAQIGRLHAAAVVFHQDQVGAAIGRRRCRCGVAPASSAFSTSSFTARGRTLHHFAGGDAVDRAFD